MSENVISSTKKSILWGVIGSGGTQALTMFSTLILARLIAPAEFGLIAMITVLSNFASMFIDMGFGTALIYKEDITKKDIDTVFSINMSSALILTLLFFIGSGLIADFYEQPKLINLIKVVSPIFLLIALSGVNKLVAKKRLNFKIINIIDNFSILIGIPIAIVFAYLGYGAWSIIFQLLSTQLSMCILYRIYTPINQSLSFHVKEFRSLFHYGKNIIGQASISYITRSSDQLLIGRMVGDKSLGLYTKGLGIILLPITTLCNLLTQVMFPSLIQLKSNLQEFKRLYIKCVATVTFIAFPFLIIALANSKNFVLTIFGENWIQMSPYIKYFCFIAAYRALSSMNSIVYNALGKTKLNFHLSIIFNVLILIFIFVGLKENDLLGMLQAYTFAIVIILIIDYYFIVSISKIVINQLLMEISKTVIISVIMFIGIELSQRYIILLQPGWELLLHSAIGMLIYIILSYIFQRDIIISLIVLIDSKNL